MICGEVVWFVSCWWLEDVEVEGTAGASVVFFFFFWAGFTVIHVSWDSSSLEKVVWVSGAKLILVYWSSVRFPVIVVGG